MTAIYGTGNGGIVYADNIIPVKVQLQRCMHRGKTEIDVCRCLQPVVVAENKNLLPVQFCKPSGNLLPIGRHRKVTKEVACIVFLNDRIIVLDNRLIHPICILKRPTAVSNDVLVAEVCIGGEEIHLISLLHTKLKSRPPPQPADPLPKREYGA